MRNSIRTLYGYISNFMIFVAAMSFLNNVVPESAYTQATYQSKVFISADYEILQGEYLFKPAVAKENAFGEVVVLDVGNTCLYVFSDKGQFIRKIGRVGQGPGEFIKPLYFDIDPEGNIYVPDIYNSRITKFDRSGNLLNTFRIKNLTQRRILATKNQEMILNRPKSGYYITVLSSDGTIRKEIGKIENFDTDPIVYSNFGKSVLLLFEDRLLYVFLENCPRVDVYTPEGDFIEKIPYDAIEEIDARKKYHVDPKDSRKPNPDIVGSGSGGMRSQRYFREVTYKSGRFYLYPGGLDSISKIGDMRIYELDERLRVLNVIILPLDTELTYESQGGVSSLIWAHYEVKNDGDILISDNSRCQILQLFIK